MEGGLRKECSRLVRRIQKGSRSGGEQRESKSPQNIFPYHIHTPMPFFLFFSLLFFFIFLFIIIIIVFFLMGRNGKLFHSVVIL